ncbi:MAG TPA: hypothetical protein GX523_02565 [Desulfitobacterium dehalogenans]|uniref:Uncharacterized protein n=1 Tax=Desulfitobacterium dehalogenans TaxID=36854 RepID=A0A7C7D3Y0_9FIRM|nr:hypothetical protein [Desulfitobacterium dehalogenans]
MKEKEIHLTSEEIDYLLKGTIHWEDIASRTAGSWRKPMGTGSKGSESRDFLRKAPFKDIEETKDFGQSTIETKVSERNPFDEKAFERSFNNQENKHEGFKRDSNEDKANEDFLGNINEDFFEREQPFWSGTKVYIVLSLMGCITLGTWAYFVFA